MNGLPWAPDGMIDAVWIISLVILGFGLAQSAMNLLLLGISLVTLVRQPPLPSLALLWGDFSEVAPPIALIVPAHNEERTIEESVRALLSLQYPEFEVIVVNDGSQDRTLERLIESFDLRPIVRPYDHAVEHKPIRGLYGASQYRNLFVIDKERGGKADALNAGINFSRAPLFCAVDADSILEADALLRVVFPFIDQPLRTVAIGGTVRVANGCKVRSGRVIEVGLPQRLLPLIQTIEYMRSFLIARLGRSRIGALTIVSGAFGLFRRSVAVAVGGYSHGTVGEDIEIIVKMHRYLHEQNRDYRIDFVADPVCWTEVPTTLGTLARQRIRWQRGSLETLFRHKRMALNPRYGRIGLLGVGSILVVDLLNPIIEVLGYLLIPLFWALGLLGADFMLAYLAVNFAFGVCISVGSLCLEELELRRYPRAKDLAILTLAAIFENFGYRQLNNFWRVVGLFRFIARAPREWGRMTRKGFKGT